MTPDCCVLADSAVTVGGFEWWGNFTTVDLVAASTNALNGALLARRPDHYKNFTIVGILGMALLGGLGGGITRDVLLGDVPAALTNPAYITVALGFGVLGYLLAYSKGQLFREGLFQFMTSFSLPWYAIVGAQKGVGAAIPVLGCLLLAVVALPQGAGTSTSRAVSRRSSSSAASGSSRSRRSRGSCGSWSTGPVGTRGSPPAVAFVVGYTVRVLALWYAWEEPLAREPTGVYQHSDGRPLLGRKLKGKSKRELRDLGLLVEDSEGRPSPET